MRLAAFLRIWYQIRYHTRPLQKRSRRARDVAMLETPWPNPWRLVSRIFHSGWSAELMDCHPRAHNCRRPKGQQARQLTTMRAEATLWTRRLEALTSPVRCEVTRAVAK